MVSAAAARSLARVAAIGPIGLARAAVLVVCGELDESSFPRTMSQATKPAASAIATTAPIRTLERRAQPVSRGSLTWAEDRESFGGRKREQGAFEQWRFGNLGGMKKPFILLASGLAGLTLGLAGCGDDNENGGGGTSTTVPTASTEDTTTGSTTTGEEEGTTTGEDNGSGNGGDDG